ncbi:MAG: hypothetical protein HQL10_13070 [Nitrospirae bacterium]|nr:hypothetical protein [Nitrospirota bacterium]
MLFGESTDYKINRKKSIYCSILVGLFAIIVFLPALQNDFVTWDDQAFVIQNSNIYTLDVKLIEWAFFNFFASSWHPITWLSHAVDYRIWGLNPFGHHLTSILLHGINTYLVSLLCINLLNFRNSTLTASSEIQKGWILSDRGIIVAGCITGLLFGIHPLHVESVAWVSERKDLLCAFFYLLSLICYSAYAREALIDKDRNWLTDKRYLLSLLFFVCALFSKPMAVTLPVILLLLDWYPFERFNYSNLKNLFYEKLLFALFSLYVSVTVLFAQMAGESLRSFELFPFSSRILVGGDAVIMYIKMMVWPVNLINFYPFPKEVSGVPTYFISFIGVGLITSGLLMVSKKFKALFVVWFFYLIILFPVLGIIKGGSFAIADRYTYLPSISIFLLTGFGIAIVYDKVIKASNILKGLFLCFLIAVNLTLSFLTIKQIGVWHDTISLWRHAIKNTSSERDDYYRRVARMHMGLGMAYFAKGMQDECIMEFKTALDIEPRNTDVRISLANIYLDINKLDEAIIEFKTSIADDPKNAAIPLTYIKLSVALHRVGRIFEAKTALMKADDLIKKNYENIAKQ